ncbi:MAG: hypothetical protein AAGC93_30040 [Cyanobacteria bacterium P01_F01_bin.53]
MTSFSLSLQAPNAQSFVDVDKVASISQFHQNIFASYNLKWRQNILWVTPKENQLTLGTVPVQQLVDRLKQSSVRCVCVDVALGEAHLKTWSDACGQAGKKLHLRTPKGSAQNVSTSQRSTVKRFFQNSLRWLELPSTQAMSDAGSY